MPKIVLRRTPPIVTTFTKTEGDENMVDALSAVYGNIDSDNEVFDVGAFDNPETEERVKGGFAKLMDTHGRTVRETLGKVIAIENRPEGLLTRSKFSTDTDSQAARTKVLDGTITHQSVRYRTLEDRLVQHDDGETRRHFVKAVLWETSLCPFPANLEAWNLAAKEEEIDEDEDGSPLLYVVRGKVEGPEGPGLLVVPHRGGKKADPTRSLDSADASGLGSSSTTKTDAAGNLRREALAAEYEISRRRR